MLQPLRLHRGHCLSPRRPLTRKYIICNSLKDDNSRGGPGDGDETAGSNDSARRLGSLLVSALATCSLLLSAPVQADAADSLTIKFRVSRNPEIRSAQELLVQTWGYVSQLYYDPTFNHQDWEKVLQTSLDATFKARSRQEALQQVELMLGSLGDPFTRVLLPGGASEAFQAITQSKLLSTGLRVERGAEPDSPLRVSHVTPGLPAAEAGLREGDEVVAVNGRPVPLRGRDARVLEELRRDKEVALKVRRPSTPDPVSLGSRTRARPAASGAGEPLSVRGLSDAALPPGDAKPRDRRASEVEDPAAGSTSTISAQQPQSPGDQAASYTERTAAADRESSHEEGLTGTSTTATAAVAAAATAASAGSTEALLATERGLLSVASSGSGSASTSTSASSSTSTSASTSYQLPGRFIDVHLRPVPIEYVPVQYAVLTNNSTTASGRAIGRDGAIGTPVAGPAAAGGLGAGAPSAVAPSASRVGYIRIVTFSGNVAKQVEEAIVALKAAGCGSWLLDVRLNPGGLVAEGLSVAELLMQPGEVFAVVRDRSGQEVVERLPDSARALVEGQPLAVLVDRDSASTSELLAAALHDDSPHALLYGERTYGKGHTQRVVPLYGGATLLVSTDTYVTPARRVVDRVGLAPDVACRPGDPPALVPRRAKAPDDVPAAGEPGSSPASASAAAAATGSAGSPQSAESVAGSLRFSEAGSGAGDGGSEGRRVGGDAEGVLEAGQVEGLLRDPCVRAAVGKLARGGGMTGQEGRRR